MRVKSGKTRNYNSKKKIITTLNNNTETYDDEPKPTLHNAAFTMHVKNIKEWYDLFNVRYYEKLQEVYNIVWTDTSDKNGENLLETKIKVMEIPQDQMKEKYEKNNTDENIINKQSPFNESIPPKSSTLFVITLYHTTQLILIQGNQKQLFVDKEYPILRTIMNCKTKNNILMLDAYHEVIETPESHKEIDKNENTNVNENINKINQDENNSLINNSTVSSKIQMIIEDNTDELKTFQVPSIVVTPSSPPTENESQCPMVQNSIENVNMINISSPSTNSEIIDFTISQQSKQNDNATNIIEMEDMSPKKTITRKRIPTVKTPTKQSQQNITKKKANNVEDVTLQMHNNLKNTINKIDDEIHNFAIRYQQEQEQITGELTNIINQLITPLQEESHQLRNELQEAHKQIEELKSFIQDNVVIMKNSNKESKRWVSTELEEMKTSIKTNTEQVKTLEQSKQTNQSNSKKNQHNGVEKTNIHQQQSQHQQPDLSPINKQQEDNQMPTSSHKLSEQNSYPNENQQKENIYIIMDSNRKFINFRDLLQEETRQENSVIVIPCGNIKKAENILQTSEIIVNPKKILIHVGINDIDNKDGKVVALDLKHLAEAYQDKFQCDVYISDITPRNDQLAGQVDTVNQILDQRVSKSRIIRVKHRNLQTHHLYDDRHLRRNKTHGEVLSGVQIFAKNIYQALLGKVPDANKLEKILRYTKNHRQTRNYGPQTQSFKTNHYRYNKSLPSSPQTVTHGSYGTNQRKGNNHGNQLLNYDDYYQAELTNRYNRQPWFDYDAVNDNYGRYYRNQKHLDPDIYANSRMCEYQGIFVSEV